ncbi:MAG: hypothetical protein OEY59_01080 [Deltaproteobacteria bacterium]|nr:hypothetical protein [Deltaproteobacteria bacterium]
MKKKQKRQSFSRDFKLEAIQLAQSSNSPKTHVAEKLEYQMLHFTSGVKPTRKSNLMLFRIQSQPQISKDCEIFSSNQNA